MPLSVNRLEQRGEIYAGVGLSEGCALVSLYRTSSSTKKVLSPDGELGYNHDHIHIRLLS